MPFFASQRRSGLGCHEVSPSGPSTRSTGSRLATTTKLRSAAFTIAAAGRLTSYRTRAASVPVLSSLITT